MEKKVNSLELLKKLGDEDLKLMVRYLYKSLLLLGVTAENRDFLDKYTKDLLELYFVAFNIMLERWK